MSINNTSFRTIYYTNGRLNKRRTYPALLKYALLDLANGRKPTKVTTAYSGSPTESQSYF